MGLIMNLKNVLFGHNHTRIGGGGWSIGFNKYEADQYNFDYPFETYATVSDVYSIVNKIARNGAKIPIVLKRGTEEDNETITEGEIYNLIQNPNSSQDTQAYIEECLIYLLLSGNIFINPLYSIGFGLPTQINNLAPQLTEIKTRFEGKYNTAEKYIYRIDGKEFNISADDVIHLKYANPTEFGIQTLRGLAPLTAGFLTSTALKNNQTASASILEHQGAAGILSNESDYSLSEEEQKRQQSLFDKKAAGMTKFGKIVQSLAKVKYTKLGLDPAQLKIIESRVMDKRDLCNIYDVPSTLFNDPQNRIQSNVTPSETALYTNAVIPNTMKIVKGVEKATLSRINEDQPDNQKYYLELDTSSIECLQKNQKEEAEKDKITIENITNVVNMNITREGKVSLLVNEIGLSEEDAERMINDTLNSGNDE